MNRQRLFRTLRIAWSVAFGILCLLLIVLWVRSYWWLNQAQLVMWEVVPPEEADWMSSAGRVLNSKVFVVMSEAGTLALAIHETPRPLVSSLFSAELTGDEG